MGLFDDLPTARRGGLFDGLPNAEPRVSTGLFDDIPADSRIPTRGVNRRGRRTEQTNEQRALRQRRLEETQARNLPPLVPMSARAQERAAGFDRIAQAEEVDAPLAFQLARGVGSLGEAAVQTYGWLRDLPVRARNALGEAAGVEIPESGRPDNAQRMNELALAMRQTKDELFPAPAAIVRQDVELGQRRNRGFTGQLAAYANDSGDLIATPLRAAEMLIMSAPAVRVAGAVGGGAVLAGGSAGVDAGQQFDEELRAGVITRSPEFMQLADRYGENAAVRMLRNDRINRVTETAGAFGALAAGATSRLGLNPVDDLLAGRAAKTAGTARGALGSGAAETTGEFGEEYGTQVATNVGARLTGSDVDLTEGAPEAGAGGLALGGITGTGVGALQAARDRAAIGGAFDISPETNAGLEILAARRARLTDTTRRIVEAAPTPAAVEGVDLAAGAFDRARAARRAEVRQPLPTAGAAIAPALPAGTQLRSPGRMQQLRIGAAQPTSPAETPITPPAVQPTAMQPQRSMDERRTELDQRLAQFRSQRAEQDAAEEGTPPAVDFYREPDDERIRKSSSDLIDFDWGAEDPPRAQTSPTMPEFAPSGRQYGQAPDDATPDWVMAEGRNLNVRKAEAGELADAFLEIAQARDQAFQLPQVPAEARTLEDIGAAVDPAMRIERMDINDIRGKYPKAREAYRISMRDGTAARFVVEEDGGTQLNAAALEEGKSGGAALYAAINTFAQRNGLRALPDRDGLTEINKTRRTEQQAASGVRTGTAQHLVPDITQAVAGFEIGGDDRANIGALLMKGFSNTVNAMPEVHQLRYNFDSGQFEWTNGEKADDADFDRLAESDPAREAGIGRSTLKRAVLAASILRETRRRGVGSGRVLGSLGRQQLQQLAAPALERIFYSRSRGGIDGDQAPSAARGQPQGQVGGGGPARPAEAGSGLAGRAGGAALPAPRTGAAPLRNSARTESSVWGELTEGLGRRMARRLRAQPWLKVVNTRAEVEERWRRQLTPSEMVGGFYAPNGDVYLIADEMREQQDDGAWVDVPATAIALHEIGVHYGLRGMLGGDFAGILADFEALAKTDARVKAAFDRVPAGTNPKDIAEEALAYFIQQNYDQKVGLVDRIMAAINRFLRRFGVERQLTPDQLLALARGAADRASRGQFREGYATRPDSAEGRERAAVEEALAFSRSKSAPDRKLEMAVTRKARELGTGELTASEEALLRAEAQTAGLDPDQIVDAARKVKARFPVEQGWAPLEVVGLKTAKELKDEAVAGQAVVIDGAVDRIKWKAQPYNFHLDANGKNDAKTRNARVAAMAREIVGDMRQVVERAKRGDANAQAILHASGWYSEMRNRLRAEFGGLGDLFADLLGATSPNTPVRTNWDFAIDALGSALSGRLDGEIDAFADVVAKIEKAEALLASELASRTAKGKGRTPETKKAVLADPGYAARAAEIKQMRKAAAARIAASVKRAGTNAKGGESRYGINNYNVMRALVGLWRKLEVGSAPKAINFSGNLIGYSRRATIDVWAARYLRDLASRAVSAVSFARVPPVAEKGVGGKVGKDLLPGGEFGFGQDVMAEAARMLRESGMPAFRDTQADDLQAVVWFLEKERWGTNAWTSKTGEGGSFELEANLAGDPDREGIADLRRRANAGVPKNIREQYEPGRQKDLQKHAAKVDAAKEELRRRQSPVDAFIGGLSPSMSETTQGVDFKPSADDMASGATALKRVAAQDPKLIAAKVTATEGRYGPDRETSFDIELVTRNGYDVETFFGEMLKIARHYSQDSVFISRKIQPGQSIDPTQHNPGVEVYFQDMMDAADPAMAKTLEQIKRLIQNSQGEYAGFTLITDAGVSRSQRAGEQPPVVGVRLQYIPEFDVRYGGAELDAMSPDDYSAHVVARRDELQKLANTIQKRVAGVSYAHQFWYDTEVRFSHEYDEAIRASEAGRGEAESRPGSWAGRFRREGLRAAARQSAEGGVPRVGRLPDRYGVRGDETLKFSRSGNRRGDVGGPDATGNRLGQALPQGGVAPPSFSARKPQRDAVAALAVHYSPVGGLNALDPTFAGTAFAGGERRRFGPGRFGLESPRLNFYVQEEGGPQPGKEQALASAKNGYSVRLTNLYDYAADPRGFVADTYPNVDALEEEVADAGFDGILFDRVAGIPNRTAVLFGFKKKVPVAPVEDAGVFGEDRIRKSSSGTSTITVDGIARPRTDSAGKSIHPTERSILKSSSAAEQPRDDLGRFAEKPEGRAPQVKPDKRFSTSTKNEVMEEERALLAKDPVFSALPSRAHEDLVIEARQTLKRDPGAAEQLAYELSEGMVSTVSEEQEALLLVGKIELMKKRAEVARVAFDRRYSEERRNKARYDWDQIESRVTMLDVATKTTGAIWARTGLLRQRVLREDFTFDSMAEKLARAHGRPLTANEAEELTQMAEKIRSQEIALDEARQKLDEAADLAESQRMLTDMVTRATRYLRSETKARSRSLLDVMRQMADESRAALARMDARKVGVNRPSQRKQGGAVDVARIFHLTRIGAAELVEMGYTSATWSKAKYHEWRSRMRRALGPRKFAYSEDLMPGIAKQARADLDKINATKEERIRAALDVGEGGLTHADVYELIEALVDGGMRGETEIMEEATRLLQEAQPGIALREVRRLFTDYGRARFPSNDEVKRETRKLRELQRIQESIDRLEEGLPALKTGQQRDKTDAEIRERRKRLNELLRMEELKSAADPTRLATFQDARISNLKNLIADLKRMLETGERPIAIPSPPPTDEMVKLQAEVADLRKKIREQDRTGAASSRAAKRLLEREEMLARRLADLQKRMLTGEGPAKRAPKTDKSPIENQIAALQAQLRAIERAKKPRLSRAERINRARIRALEREEELLTEELLTTLRRPASEPVPPTAEVEAKAAAVAALRQQVRDLRASMVTPEQAEQAYQLGVSKLLARQIKVVEARLASGDYSPRKRADKPMLDAANRETQFQLRRLKHAFAVKVFEAELAKRTKFQKLVDGVIEGFNITRSIMTSIDWSAILRQSLFTFGHPIKAAKIFGPMVKATFSAARNEDIEESIRRRPNYPLYEKAKLHITESHGFDPRRVEEQFTGRWLERMEEVEGQTVRNYARRAHRLATAPVRGSARAYSTFTNLMRVEMFDALHATLVNDPTAPTQAELEAVANLVNVFTGRGTFGKKVDAGGTALSLLLFAPRYLASRLNVLSLQPILRGAGASRRVAKLAAMEYARTLTGLGVIYAMAALYQATMGGEDDEDDWFASVDPRSCDFGKVKFGNVYLDPMAGLAQVTTFLSRMLTRETVAGEEGEVRSLGPDRAYGQRGAFEVMSDFARSKLSPGAGFVVNTISGEGFGGEVMTPADAAGELVMPLAWREVPNVIKERGLPEGMGLMALSWLGMGIQYRDPDRWDQIKQDREDYAMERAR